MRDSGPVKSGIGATRGTGPVVRPSPERSDARARAGGPGPNFKIDARVDRIARSGNPPKPGR